MATVYQTTTQVEWSDPAIVKIDQECAQVEWSDPALVKIDQECVQVEWTGPVEVSQVVGQVEYDNAVPGLRTSTVIGQVEYSNDRVLASSIIGQVEYTDTAPRIVSSHVMGQVEYSYPVLFVSNVAGQIEYTSTPSQVRCVSIIGQVEYKEGDVPVTDAFIAASPRVPVVMAKLQTSGGQIRRATTFYVNTNGEAFLPGLIFPTLKGELRNVFSGVEASGELTIQMELGGGGLSTDLSLAYYADNFELRGSTLTIYSYDPVLGENIDEAVDFYGKVDSWEMDDCHIWFKCQVGNDDGFDKLLPPDLVTAERFHESALDIGAPINMPFGLCRDIPCPNIRQDYDNDDYWYLISYSGIEDLVEVRRDGWIVPSAEYELEHGLFFDYIKFSVEQRSFTGTMHKITATVQGFKPRYQINMIINGNIYLMSPSDEPAAHHVADVIKMMLTHVNSINDEFGVNEESFEAAKVALGDAETLWKVDINIGGEQKRAGDWLNDILSYMPIHLYRGYDGKWCLSVDTVAVAPTFFVGQNDGYYNNCVIGKRRVEAASSCIKKVTMQYNFSEAKLDKYGVSIGDPWNYEISATTGKTFGVEKSIALVAVNDTATAKKMLSRIINTSKYSDKWISLECGPEIKTAHEGETVRVFTTYPDIYKDYIIHNISKNHSGKYDLECREYDARIFDEVVIADPSEPVETTTTVNGPTAIPYTYAHVDGTRHNIELTPNEISGYDFGGQHNGVIYFNGHVLHRLRATRKITLPLNLTGSHFYTGEAASATTVFAIRKYRNIEGDTIDIGTATFAAGAKTAVFNFPAAVTLLAGDIFYLIGPDGPDGTLADFGWSFVAVKESEWTV